MQTLIMGDFVSFEIAKKLKEKGFREECLYHYPKNDEDYVEANFIPGDDRYDINTDYLYQRNNEDSERLIDAPTIEQVLKWLRDEKLVLIGLSPMQEYDCNGIIEWSATIFKSDKQGGLSLQEELYYQSYEEAALAAIEYVLDNLI